MNKDITVTLTPAENAVVATALFDYVMARKPQILQGTLSQKGIEEFETCRELIKRLNNLTKEVSTY